MTYSIYTDGGCSGNKNGSGCIGAHAFVIVDEEGWSVTSGDYGAYDTTNNKQEIMGAVAGLERLMVVLEGKGVDPKSVTCSIVTDSKYLSDNYTNCLPQWKEKGWVKFSGRPLLNLDYWKKLDEAASKIGEVKFRWVKGHDGNRYNETADRLVKTRIAITKQQQQTSRWS